MAGKSAILFLFYLDFLSRQFYHFSVIHLGWKCLHVVNLEPVWKNYYRFWKFMVFARFYESGSGCFE